MHTIHEYSLKNQILYNNLTEFNKIAIVYAKLQSTATFNQRAPANRHAAGPIKSRLKSLKNSYNCTKLPEI